MEMTVKTIRPTTSASQTSIRSKRDRLGVLAAVCLAALILPLSFTGGAIATPVIGRDLGGSPLALNWITNAFMLSFGSLLMTAGALADALGRKRLFASGVLLFTVGSLATVWAPGIVWLDVLRAIQGIAAACALAGGSAALAQEFEGHARTRAFSLLGTSFGVGLAFGPVLAGMLIEWLGWRAVFVSSAVVGTLALLLGVPRMRESRDPEALHFDLLGASSFTTMLVLLTWGVLQLPSSGWDRPLPWAVLVGAGFAGWAFLHVERRARRPMLDVSLFRYPRFLGVQMLPIATAGCYVVLLVQLPLQLIGIKGQSEIGAGLTMVALSAPLLAVPSVAAALTRWVSASRLCASGLLIAAGGLFWLSRVDARQASALIAPLVVIGIGTGLPWGLMDGLAVSVVPTERAGMATGIFSTVRVAGEGVAIAIVGALLTLLIQLQLPASTAAQGFVLAQDLATGNLASAVGHVPHLHINVLMHAYDNAFRRLTDGLIAVSVLSAAVAGWLLDEGEVRATTVDRSTSW